MISATRRQTPPDRVKVPPNGLEHNFERGRVYWLENSIFKAPQFAVDQSCRRGVKFLEQFISASRRSSCPKDPRNWSRAIRHDIPPGGRCAVRHLDRRALGTRRDPFSRPVSQPTPAPPGSLQIRPQRQGRRGALRGRLGHLHRLRRGPAKAGCLLVVDGHQFATTYRSGPTFCTPARALGLTVPPTLLALVDRAIE